MAQDMITHDCSFSMFIYRTKRRDFNRFRGDGRARHGKGACWLLRRGFEGCINTDMSYRIVSAAPLSWRTASIAVACAIAGGWLRWCLREPGSTHAFGALIDPPASANQPAPPPAHITPASLGILSHRNKLAAIAAALPDMTEEEIGPVV